MKKKEETKAFLTLDGKQLLVKDVIRLETDVQVKMIYTNKFELMLHTQICTGEHKGKEFRLISEIAGRAHRLEYDGRALTVDVQSLVSAMMDKLQELKKQEKKPKEK